MGGNGSTGTDRRMGPAGTQDDAFMSVLADAVGALEGADIASLLVYAMSEDLGVPLRPAQALFEVVTAQ
ncbi:MAG TPA: hypothetical protein VFH50_00530 [Acidimicrobiales bacterium]|nr:hypothetical protein [Acidimicrobiales bacterium]